MAKNISSFNLDERLLGTLETLSKQKGLSKSVLVERLITIGLKSDSDLTSDQRYHFARCVIENRCTDMLRLHGIIEHVGGLSEKIQLICALQAEISASKNAETRNGIIKISIYEVLNEIKAWDINVFEKTMKLIWHHKKLKDDYFYLYPREK